MSSLDSRPLAQFSLESRAVFIIEVVDSMDRRFVCCVCTDQGSYSSRNNVILFLDIRPSGCQWSDSETPGDRSLDVFGLSARSCHEPAARRFCSARDPRSSETPSPTLTKLTTFRKVFLTISKSKVHESGLQLTWFNAPTEIRQIRNLHFEFRINIDNKHVFAYVTL